MILTMTRRTASSQMFTLLVGLVFLGTILSTGFSSAAQAKMSAGGKGKMIGVIGGAALGIAVLAMLGPVTLVAGAIYAIVGGSVGYVIGGAFGKFIDWFEKETGSRNSQIDRITRDDSPDM